MAEVLHEVEEWAPVCKAVFGVIGACLVASGRGKANEAERRRFYERMVSLGKTLMQVRGSFAHNPPPQMEDLLTTLKSALVWIETFDGRGWFMRALKSSADKDALKSFNDSITALCSDMSISLQAAAHRDEHMVLRHMTGVLMHEMRKLSHEVRSVGHQHNRIQLHPSSAIDVAGPIPEDAPEPTAAHTGHANATPPTDGDTKGTEDVHGEHGVIDTSAASCAFAQSVSETAEAKDDACQPAAQIGLLKPRSLARSVQPRAEARPGGVSDNDDAPLANPGSPPEVCAGLDTLKNPERRPSAAHARPCD